MYPRVEIMDTTLRDGEQTSGVSFNAREKLSIARLLLEELCVSRIEIASARVSQGEQEAVRRIAGRGAIGLAHRRRRAGLPLQRRSLHGGGQRRRFPGRRRRMKNQKHVIPPFCAQAVQKGGFYR